MHEFEFFRLVGTRGAQGFDHAKAHATATVNGNASGFVDHDHPFVLVDDRGRHGRLQTRGDLAGQSTSGAASRAGATAGVSSRLRRRLPNRRQPDVIAEREPRIDPGALTVDPNFALADQTEQPGTRYLRILACKELVEAGAGILAVHREVTYREFPGVFRKILFFHGLRHSIRAVLRTPPKGGDTSQTSARCPPVGG